MADQFEVVLETHISGVEELLVGFNVLPAQIDAANREALQASLLTVEAEAKQRVARKSGRLFSSIHADPIEQVGPVMRGTVGTDVEYAADVEYGTQPHEIRPISAQALMVPISPLAGASSSIFGGGRLTGSPRAGQQVAFFKVVHHPGTRAEPFLGPALEAAIPAIQSFFSAAADKVLALLGRP